MHAVQSTYIHLNPLILLTIMLSLFVKDMKPTLISLLRDTKSFLKVQRLKHWITGQVFATSKGIWRWQNNYVVICALVNTLATLTFTSCALFLTIYFKSLTHTTILHPRYLMINREWSLIVCYLLCNPSAVQ